MKVVERDQGPIGDLTRYVKPRLKQASQTHVSVDLLSSLSESGPRDDIKNTGSYSQKKPLSCSHPQKLGLQANQVYTFLSGRQRAGYQNIQHFFYI